MRKPYADGKTQDADTDVFGSVRRAPLKKVAPIPTKRVSIRLDLDVITALKADGRGWKLRANEALRKSLNL